MKLARTADMSAIRLPDSLRATGTSRRFPIGAELIGDQVHVRLWAPDRGRAVIAIDGRLEPLSREAGGYFSAVVDGQAGSRYGFQFDADTKTYPDPASRYQPDGPHGLSEVIDATTFQWTDDGWSGVDLDHPVVYEIHLGTFTAAGTAAAAEAHLEDLASLGITVVQLMPIAEFPGQFGWGYDGVGLFAPSRLYGRPDDIRHLVDRAHALGMAVILDVVYNHVGPDGNYLRAFAKGYFSERYENEWGDALNFDGADAAPVREWVLTNVAYWIREFHVDGFRLDATQQIYDASPEHLVTAIARVARQTAATRTVMVTAENEPQDATLLRPAREGGSELDAIYNEDLHHSLRVFLVGTREAYFSDYQGTANEWLACARRGVLFQGQHYPWQKQGRGTPGLGVSPSRLINFLENHDQVANASGRRLVDLARPSDLRAMLGLLFMMPGIPMIFQGQEFGSRRPFVYFAHHEAPLRDAVATGRREFLEQFERLRDHELYKAEPLPHEREAWEQCVLDRDTRDRAEPQWRALITELARLRRLRPRRDGAYDLDGAAPDQTLLLLRYFGDGDADWLVVLNAGPDRDVAAVSEPLIAPPAQRSWTPLFSSEHPRYGGQGRMAWVPGHWPAPGHSLLVLQATTKEDAPA
jgi:maltooligosyltrehalose trehalohydrolase